MELLNKTKLLPDLTDKINNNPTDLTWDLRSQWINPWKSPYALSSFLPYITSATNANTAI